jgi:phosphatidate phosphatase PAH1
LSHDAAVLVMRLGIAAVVACAAMEGVSHGQTAPTTPAPTVVAPPSAAGAVPCSSPPRREGWAHHVHGGRVASRMGAPHHAAVDLVVPLGRGATLEAKFAYGPSSKDVEDEWVALWREESPCVWREIARGRTDDDGRIRFPLAATVVPTVGRHGFRMVLVGDASLAEASVWVVAPATPAVLFDIDGTLTVDDGELFEDLAGGGAPRMHAGADAVARRWAELGYLPVYVTGRPYFLRGSTGRWLRARDFPDGPLLTVDTMGATMPSESGVGRFKHKALAALQHAGLRFARAYGNASTDVCAYYRAGIPPARTHIVGSARRACGGAPAALPLPSYVRHLPELTDDLRAPRTP